MAQRVFVSSTFQDLEPYRQAVRDAIRRLGAIDVSMEHFGARDNRPKDECLRLIEEESDVFVGIYAHRYGHIPQGENTSILEAEYHAATSANHERLIYLVDESMQWPQRHKDEEQELAKLLAFKDRLKARHICSFFSNKDQLAADVAADLGRYFSEGVVHVSEGHRGILHQPPPEWTSPHPSNRWRYKVIAFDLDGTLLRGQTFQFSWEAVWGGLDFSRGIQSDLKREYRRKTQGDHSDAQRIQAYRQWCQKACRYFMTRKLTREKLSEIIDPLQLTNNFAPAISRMREEGFILAIISGGTNCFLEEKIPDFKDCFDFVFINELMFDPEGLLNDVAPTEFDFEGKAKALEYICDRAGCAKDETVFVGDAFNDEAIMLAAGLSIAYPPRGNVPRGVAQILVGEDNLELILPHIRVE